MSNRKVSAEQYEFLIQFAVTYHAFFSVTQRKEDFLAKVLRARNIPITVRQARAIMNGSIRRPTS